MSGDWLVSRHKERGSPILGVSGVLILSKSEAETFFTTSETIFIRHCVDLDRQDSYGAGLCIGIGLRG